METLESGNYQVFVKLLDGKHKIFNFNDPLISVTTLKSRIQALTSIPSPLQFLQSSNSRILYDHQILTLALSTGVSERQNCFSSCDNNDSGDLQFPSDAGNFPVVVHLLLRLRGGKGGFGSLLRGAATKAGQKKTNNFDACRDMSGRRLRHVNAEKKLEEWRAGADERNLERMAEEFLKKKAIEVSKSGKNKGNDSAEKYVAKYREDSAKCMEEVERSVRESIKGLMSSKRKDGADEQETNSKRLKIWLGKKKLGDSDSEDDVDENDGDEAEVNAKSMVTDSGNYSESSRDYEGSSDSYTCVVIHGCSPKRNSPGSQEEVANGKSPKSNDNQDEYVDDWEDIHTTTPIFASAKVSKFCNTAEMEVAPEPYMSKEMFQKPLVTVPMELTTSVLEVTHSTNCEPAEEVSLSFSEDLQDLDRPLDFNFYNSAAELGVLGMEKLKMELQAHGLKCGGTLHERATRLFMLKTVPLEKVPKKLFAKK